MTQPVMSTIIIDKSGYIIKQPARVSSYENSDTTVLVSEFQFSEHQPADYCAEVKIMSGHWYFLAHFLKMTTHNCTYLFALIA